MNEYTAIADIGISLGVTAGGLGGLAALIFGTINIMSNVGSERVQLRAEGKPDSVPRAIASVVKKYGPIGFFTDHKAEYDRIFREVLEIPTYHREQY